MTLDPVDDQSNAASDIIALALSASEAGQGTLAYSAAGLPPGLTINSTTGAISGTITLGADAASPYQVTVSVGDGVVSVNEAFAWVVGHLSLSNPGNQVSVDGQAELPLQVNDAYGDSLTFSSVGLPPGLTLDSSTGVIAGTLSSTADAGSAYLVTVMATDRTYSGSQEFTWQVQVVAVVNPGDQTTQEGAYRLAGSAGPGADGYRADILAPAAFLRVSA